MKIFVLMIASLPAMAGFTEHRFVQDKGFIVPAKVKMALMKKYPEAKKVHWEKEKGNYEGNWGGKSKEDTSVVFSPAGDFVEEVLAIPVASLPATINTYVQAHYGGAKIKEAGRVTDAGGARMFEAEIKGKDLIFDEAGNFIKED